VLFDWQNTTREIAAANCDLALLPVATMEQHGEHVPVGTKALILDSIARRVGEELPGAVYLLPTLPFGTSGIHAGTPGTIYLSWGTLSSLLRDLIESLLCQGIRRVVVFAGLGQATSGTIWPLDNSIVKTAVRQLNFDHPELQAIWVQPLGVARQGLLDIFQTADREIHAGEVVTSLLMHLRPELVRCRRQDYEPAASRGFLYYTPFSALCPAGVWGYPSLASGDKGGRALKVIVRGTVDHVTTTLEYLGRIHDSTQGGDG
jgi:creatinine amidohydrolase